MYMYFAVVKLSFEATTDSSQYRKDLRQLTEKIRARFKVCAAACNDDPEGTAIAITALGSSEERLSHTLDAIAEFCETSGYGRILSEQTLLDHLDALADFAEAAD